MTNQLLNSESATSLEIESKFDLSILSNISVTPPYFALKNFRCNGEYVYSDFTTELLSNEEEGPISGAEVGRHMAILGSVVLSKENPRQDKHYYLATDAIITRLSSKASANYSLTACAKLVSMDRKQGAIDGYILDQDGSKLFEIQVKYIILLKSIFERMFMANQMETPADLGYNPYSTDTPFTNLKIDVQSCSASIGIVEKEHCIGHFANYPALPVARLASSMGKMGGMHFMHLNPSSKKKFFFRTAEVHANQLVFVGEEVKLRTEIVDLNPEKGMVIRTIAYTDKFDNVAESVCNYHY